MKAERARDRGARPAVLGILGLGLSALAACHGVVGNLPGPPNMPPPSMCMGTSPALQAPAPLPRLSRSQYIRVLTDVIKAWLPATNSQIINSMAVVAVEAQLAPDSRVTGSSDSRGGFSRLDQAVTQDQADAMFAIAQTIATEMTKSSDRVQALLGRCATDTDPSNDDACLRTFIQKAGRVAHRRALDQDDVDFYMSVYGATGIDPAGLADVIVVMLSSPYLIYRVEHGGDAVDEAADLYALDGQELANRLALQYWGTIPDDTLNGMVDSGSLVTDDGYAAALAHVAGDARLQNTLTEFYREYLSLDDLAEMDRLKGTAHFDAVRGSFNPTGDTRENMIGELTRLAIYYTQKADGKLDDLFTTRKSFATTADVATIYGMSSPWSGDGDPPDMPDGQHVGILTHAALVASGAAVTRPIIKGVIARSVLLCDDIGQPPANAMMVAQDTAATLDPVASTRTLTEELTTQRADCAGCHATVINPLGFATENFDPLGRLRTVESIFDDKGTMLGTVPIDTTTVPRVLADDPSSVSSAAELQMKMLASYKVQDCLARKYFRFTFNQREDAQTDACTVETLSSGLIQGKPLGQVLLDLAKTPAFKQRRFN